LVRGLLRCARGLAGLTVLLTSCSGGTMFDPAEPEGGTWKRPQALSAEWARAVESTFGSLEVQMELRRADGRACIRVRIESGPADLRALANEETDPYCTDRLRSGADPVQLVFAQNSHTVFAEEAGGAIIAGFVRDEFDSVSAIDEGGRRRTADVRPDGFVILHLVGQRSLRLLEVRGPDRRLSCTAVGASADDYPPFECH
jgi:hypothetical protein